MFFQKKTSFVTILWSFIAGAFAGAITALFFTPLTGKKFQRKVADVTGKVIDKVEDLRKFA